MFLFKFDVISCVFLGFGFWPNLSEESQNLDNRSGGLEISKKSKTGEKLYSELQSALELYDKESLQSKVVKETEKWGLYESVDPPLIIHNKNSDK